jgi:hypothetical protein
MLSPRVLCIALCLTTFPTMAIAKMARPAKVVCPQPITVDQAARELEEAKAWIKRAGEHPAQVDLAEILPRLHRAAYAGNQEARIRFGTYVVGYYYTDEMFWPSEPNVAIPALAMLIIAAHAEPDSRDSLLQALAKDPIAFTDPDGPPALPRRWIAAALRETKRLSACAEQAKR